MFYIIQNPSDAMTIEADEDLIAALAGVYLGQGQVGITSEADEEVLPILAFSGDEALVSWLKTVGIEGVDGLKDALMSRKDEIAVCLESIVYGYVGEHKWINKVFEGRDHAEKVKAIYEWNDMKRSSMNNYAKVAFQLAKQIRELEEKDIPDPEDTTEAETKA